MPGSLSDSAEGSSVTSDGSTPRIEYEREGLFDDISEQEYNSFRVEFADKINNHDEYGDWPGDYVSRIDSHVAAIPSDGRTFMVHYDVNTDDDGNETIAVQKVTPWEDENDGYDPEWWTDKSSDLSLLLIAGGLSGFLLNRSVEWSHPGVIIMFGLAILLGLPKIILLLYQNS